MDPISGPPSAPQPPPPPVIAPAPSNGIVEAMIPSKNGPALIASRR